MIVCIDNYKMYVTFIHHLSCLNFDKDYKNDNIHFDMVECDENMTKSCYASFLTFLLYYETNPI